MIVVLSLAILFYLSFLFVCIIYIIIDYCQEVRQRFFLFFAYFLKKSFFSFFANFLQKVGKFVLK